VVTAAPGRRQFRRAAAARLVASLRVRWLLVFLGGGLGAMLRVAAALWVDQRLGPEALQPGEVPRGRSADPSKGDPDPAHVSTSHVERQNLTMRMSMRRFTRLTNVFSKKIENLQHAVALHFMHYNFARIHQTLRVTPAMEAGVSDHVWSIEEIVGLLGSN
jgi:hypothetical protein